MKDYKPPMEYKEFVLKFFAHDGEKYLDKAAIKEEMVNCGLCSDEERALLIKHGFKDGLCAGVKMDIGGIKFEVCIDHLIYLFTQGMPYPG